MNPIVMKPKNWLTPPRHGRRRYSQAKLLHLLDNIKCNGFFTPIEALPSGEIVSGYHRWLAAMLDDGMTDVPTRILSEPLTATEIRIRRVSENLQRVDLSFWDKYLECKGFVDDEPEISHQEIAAMLNVNKSTITRVSVPGTLHRRRAACGQARPDRRQALLRDFKAAAGTPDHHAGQGAGNPRRRGRQWNGATDGRRRQSQQHEVPGGERQIGRCQRGGFARRGDRHLESRPRRGPQEARQGRAGKERNRAASGGGVGAHSR